MESNDHIFITLFRQAFEKCFGQALTNPLTETESKLMSTAIMDATGLVIGMKSLKNYSVYVLNPGGNNKENPSVATLDTLARYVLHAPYTSETERKKSESHYPYWHQFRKTNAAGNHVAVKTPIPWKPIVAWVIGVVVAVLTGWMIYRAQSSSANFTETFDDTSLSALEANGWELKFVDSLAWKNSGSHAGHLTLNTDYGDNWSDHNDAHIRNLLVRKVDDKDFSVEVNITGFVPEYNWQQAGLILSEDESFRGKVVRLSLSYNDFFGGYTRDSEIIIQGLSSSESGDQSKPEEFAHFVLFSLDSIQGQLARKNLARSSLKIEKHGNRFKFLYAVSPGETFAFKEVTTREFSIEPKYVGIFAMQGLAADGKVMPVRFDSFSYVQLQ